MRDRTVRAGEPFGTTLSRYTMPPQGAHLYGRCWVLFRDAPNNPAPGMYIRADADAPYLHIMKLDDGRVVTSNEVNHKVAKK